MTKKVFWQDPYLTQLDTHIANVEGDNVRVEETIFYALSGGQESDHGMIAGKRVLEARKQGNDIVYTLEADHGLRPGDAVRMEIDWQRRYKLMRLHLAAELVLELMYQNFASIEKVGAHIAQDKARIDFEWEGSISEKLPLIRKKALTIVEADKTIISAFSNKESQRRYWEIEGFARVPCGGTHLKKTGEIGDIKLKRKNPGKGKERIEIYLD
jgi:Ser-tRNA(Ala) deacylase AlaX